MSWEEIIKWLIPSILSSGFIGLFLGKFWEKNDKRNAKDAKTLELIKHYLPSQIIEFIGQRILEIQPLLIQ